MADQGKITFIYSLGQDFQRFHVSGVIGSVNPQGMVIANLYFEYASLPEYDTATITTEGRLTFPDKPAIKPKFEREIQTSLIFPPHVAKAIGKWLIEKAEQAEDAIGPTPS